MDTPIELFDIQSYLSDRRIDYVTEGKDVTAGWVGIKCPFCDDPGRHLGINLSSNLISCWRCGAKGSAIKIVQEIEKSFSEALRVIEEYPRPYYQQTVEVAKAPIKKFRLPEKFSRVIPNAIPAQIRGFLRRRGFNPETTAKQKELYYANYNSHRYCNRLIIPVFVNRKMASFVARDVTGRARFPYYNCPNEWSSVPLKETLYGYDEVSPGDCIIIVEGVLDQWKLGRRSLATYGTQWTLQQIQLIKSLKPSKVYTLFDNEPEAQKSAALLTKKIWFSDVENLTLKNHKDPGELTLAEGQSLMAELS